MKIRESRFREEDDVSQIREETIDQIAEEITELLLDSVAAKAALRKSREEPVKDRDLERKNLMELVRLKNRVKTLENRVEKFIKNFQIATTESSRLITDKVEQTKDMNEQIIMNLQGQLEDLRTAMIKLSNKLKELSEKR